MLNDKSGSLLLEECNFLKKFNYDLVKDIERQISYTEELIKNIKEANVLSEETSLNYAFLNFYKKRCENILKIYFYKRFLLTNDQNVDLLSDDEKNRWEYIEKAKKEYFCKFSGIDLYKNESPPDSLYIQIYCLKDSGIVYDNENIIDLVKGRIYFVKKRLVEHLLEEGCIEIIKDDL